MRLLVYKTKIPGSPNQTKNMLFMLSDIVRWQRLLMQNIFNKMCPGMCLGKQDVLNKYIF